MNRWSLFLILAAAVSASPLGAESWKSPRGGREVRLVADTTPAGELQGLTVDGVPLTILGNSGIRRENHGYGWLESATTQWVDGRFLVFEDESGLAMVDTEENQLLINQVVTGYSKSPDGRHWVAIRLRNVPRDQEALTGDENDTLWFLDPETLAQSSGSSSEEKPFGHVPSVQVGGIALAPPEWSEDGSSFTLPIYSNGSILRETYNVASRRRAASSTVRNPGISREQLLSLRFLPEVKRAIDQAIAPDLSSGSGSRSERRDPLRSTKQGVSTERDSDKQAISSGPALWIGIVAIAAIAGLAALIKRAGKS
jgi:hypothetical protein